MHNTLEKWINENKYRLEIAGIVTDEITVTGEEVEIPCTRIDQSSNKCIGRICAWKDGSLDFEVLDIQSEKRLMIAHYEEQEEVECFIQPYIKIMVRS